MDDWIKLDREHDDGGLFSVGSMREGTLELNPKIEEDLAAWKQWAGMTDTNGNSLDDEVGTDTAFVGDDDDGDENAEAIGI